MIPFLAAALLFQTQDKSLLPVAAPIAVPNEVRDWPGFKYLPEGARAEPDLLPVPANWSEIKGEPAPNAAVWRIKVVLLERMDRVHERGPKFVWPGHHLLNSTSIANVKRSLPQLRALVLSATKGAVDVAFDVTEEAEAISVENDLADIVTRYLQPRINAGRYEAEDGVFRGPYQSVFVVHPMGGDDRKPLTVQGTPVSIIGLPDIEGQEADGYVASEMFKRWQGDVGLRATEAGATAGNDIAAKLGEWPAIRMDDWPATVLGVDDSTESRLRLLSTPPIASVPLVQLGAWPAASGPLGSNTAVKIAKDPMRGNVLVVEEAGPFRGGGFALPWIPDKANTAGPTFAFWAKSDASDPIVLRFVGGKVVGNPEPYIASVRLGQDVPFAYDGAWHRVKISLSVISVPLTQVIIGPAEEDRKSLRQTLGPIVSSFSDFEVVSEAPDSKPTPEAPSPTAESTEARAAWAASAEPGDARRLLMKDRNEAVRANAVAAAYAKPDAADEAPLIESALFTFEPTIYTPAIRALAKIKSPTSDEALRRALRSAAADRARGLAAEVLTESGDPKFVPLLIGLNQARSRSARLSAIRSLGRIPGGESALMRMAFLPQDDPEVKLATTLTADANDDYQGRKLLWSAVNEPSDAVRLESLRRLSYSTVKEFQAEGMKGVRDDSVGVRVGILQAWTAASRPEFVPSILLAVTDRSPRVRAAALDALGASGSVEAKDVPFSDPDPRVQLAVLRLAKSKALAIPSDVREKYRKSPDPKVRAASGE